MSSPPDHPEPPATPPRTAGTWLILILVWILGTIMCFAWLAFVVFVVLKIMLT